MGRASKQRASRLRGSSSSSRLSPSRSAQRLEHEALSITYAVGGLRKQVNAYKEYRFPGDHGGPRKWLAIIIGLLDTAEANVKAVREKESQPDEAIRAATQCTEFAYEYLEAFRGAGQEELFYPVVPPLQRMCDALKLKNDFFYRADISSNYELRELDLQGLDDLRRRTPTLRDAVDAVVPPFTRVTMPSRAFSILPHFAIVGHEIGHAIQNRLGKKDQPVAEENRPDFKVLLKRIEGRLRRDYPDLKLSRSQIEEGAKVVFTNWSIEFAADAFGFYLMGPAMFFALSEFLLITASGWGASRDYPPNHLRRDFLFQQMKAGGEKSFARVFERETGEKLTITINNALIPVETGTERIYDDIRAGGDPERGLTACAAAELVVEMRGLRPDIYKFAFDRIASIDRELIYSPERFARDLKEHVPAMVYAIPPIESYNKMTGKMMPVDFVSILNIGWVVLLTKLEELKIGEAKIPRDRRVEVLQGLISKAVELSEARRVWEAAC